MNNQADWVTKWKSTSSQRFNAIKKFLKGVKKNKKIANSTSLDEITDDFFEENSCIDCANCCKTISPIVRHSDIKRISKYLGLKQDEFIETYLERDNDDDFIIKSKPCPFLDEQNLCSIYEDRPSDCRKYPHLEEEGFNDLIGYHSRNLQSCPASYYILQEMERRALGK